MRASRGVVGTLIALGVVSAPNLALACAVCFSIKDESNQIAYLATTGFMTVVPLLVIAGAVWWLRKRALELSVPAPLTADAAPLRVVRASQSDAPAAES